MLEDFDPSSIADEAVRQVVVHLMNLVENLSAKVQEQAEEIQRLRDENNQLKGEQGKPKIKANKPAPDLSSEKERRESKSHPKARKQPEIRIDRVEVVKIAEECLPQDAQFKGYEEVIVQDIDFRTENIQFRKEKYYSPSQKQTYLANLPAGYKGQFGPRVNGKNEQCHVLCNPFYTAYCPLPAKDRLSLLRVLMGGTDPVFRFNE